jgi:hypothetical protein
MPLQPTDFTQGEESNVSILTNPHNNQQLHIRGSELGASNGFYLSESDGSLPTGTPKQKRRLPFFQGRGGSESESTGGSRTSHYRLNVTKCLLPTASAQAPSPADVTAISSSTSNMSLKEMDQTNLGMEFVLR